MESSVAQKAQSILDRFNNLYKEAMERADRDQEQSFESVKAMESQRIESLRAQVSEDIEKLQTEVMGTLKDVEQKALSIRSSLVDSIEHSRADFEHAQEVSRATAEQIDAQTKESNDRMKQFSATMQQQLDGFDEMLSKNMKEISDDYEIRQAKFLAGLDKQLEEFMARW